MSQMDDLRHAMRHDAKPSRREVRAARTRAQVLSPMRILASLLSLPVVAVAVAVPLYLRASPYDPPDALAHLMARAGCDAAWSVGLAPAYRGGLGYHARNDADGDGVACDGFPGTETAPVPDVAVTGPVPVHDRTERMVSGAKFVRPNVFNSTSPPTLSSDAGATPTSQ